MHRQDQAPAAPSRCPARGDAMHPVPLKGCKLGQKAAAVASQAVGLRGARGIHEQVRSATYDGASSDKSGWTA